MTPQKILICGLPGSGKTTLARELQKKIPGSVWYDGDAVRALTRNYEFTDGGRMRQANDMLRLCDKIVSAGHVAIASFVCPTHALREQFAADVTIWMDTIAASPYQDTNKLWEPPDTKWVFTTFNAEANACVVRDILLTPPKSVEFDVFKPTALMVGRFQPWHEGHTALFKRALERYGQVCIAPRTMPVGPDNPLRLWEVCDKIAEALVQYKGRYHISIVPNIAAIVYGRDVGYAIDRITLDVDTEAVSASKIRDADMQYQPPRLQRTVRMGWTK